MLLLSSLLVISWTSSVLSQVNTEIDRFEDLLAVDSFNNEIVVSKPIFRKAPKKKFSKLSSPGSGRNQISTRDRFSKLRQSSDGASVFRNKMNKDGSYSFRYKTRDGMSREERGQARGQGVTGSWSYRGADGQLVEMSFVADQFGYRPQSSGLHIAHQMALKQAEMLARRSRRLRNNRRQP